MVRRAGRAEIDCDGRTNREVNAALKRLIAAGERDLIVRNPGARHNLSVAVLQPVHITFDGSGGYYCAGWGGSESMLDGIVIVHGNAGNGAAAAIRQGTVVIHGDAAARAGVSMKG